MKNSADPDQLASSKANWSGSTLFANAGYIRVQQDKGWETFQPRSLEKFSYFNIKVYIVSGRKF